MAEFRDKIPAAGGKVEYLYDAKHHGISIQISGVSTHPGFHAVYQVALSMDGKQILTTVPMGGIGSLSVAPQPSVMAFVQSDGLGMWGRNCPHCRRYFRSNHVMGDTTCPYCCVPARDIAFVTKDQIRYLTACYDAFARAYMHKQSTVVNMDEIKDETSAWHYEEIVQQFHFKCANVHCNTQTDILGEYGYCPRCGMSNARLLFFKAMDKEIDHIEEVRKTTADRRERALFWEQMTTNAVSRFEPLAKHLRRRLLLLPMTSKRRRNVENVNFQQPLIADKDLMEWFDIGFFRWANDNLGKPKREIHTADQEFIRLMLQKRHVLMHNGGIVDQSYLDLSGDRTVELDEKIEVSSTAAKRFLELVRRMAENFIDNVEGGFSLGEIQHD